MTTLYYLQWGQGITVEDVKVTIDAISEESCPVKPDIMYASGLKKVMTPTGKTLRRSRTITSL